MLTLAAASACHLCRWNFGWLLGECFILLNHTGRISGQPRQAAVEVLRHDQADGTFFIASGWSEGAHAKTTAAIPVLTLNRRGN